MSSIICIPQLKDNYSYIVLTGNEILVIDPADSFSILKYITDRKLSLKGILITHHHADHTAGIEGILNKIKVPVYSPNKKIHHTTNIVKDQDIINFNSIKIEVISTPGHTIDHIVFYNKKNNFLFSGDTLFRLGCGRIFEGTSKQMFNSLQKISVLDNRTSIYCGHEYTNTNLNFLLSIFPENKTLLMERTLIDNQIKKTGSSIPFNLGKEKELNPFLGAKLGYSQQLKTGNSLLNLELFSYLRELRNKF